MNHNYVRKCEEYLQNIPSQKLPSRQQQSNTTPGQRRMSPAAASSTTGNRNLSARKSLQQPMPGVREKQSINNPGVVGVDFEASTAKGKKFPNLGQQEKQQGSKFIRPCCRQQHQQQQQQPQQHNRAIVRSNTPGGRTGLAGRGGKAIDNVNQLDNMELAVAQPDGDYDRRAAAAGMAPRSEVEDEIKLQQQNIKSGTESWDGILTASSFALGTVTSLSQIKSKSSSDHISSPISPPGPTPTPAVSSPSSSSLSTRPTSSIVAVAPQPRLRPSAATLAPPVSGSRFPMCKSSELETGINLFRFDPLRTLQFLTLELKSKLKALGGSTGTEHKELYSISKELLLAVRILTESQRSDGQKSTEKCQRCEMHPSEPNLKNPSTFNPTNPAEMQCEICSKLQAELIQQSKQHSGEIEQLNEDIDHLKSQLLTQLNTKESKASTEQPPQPQPLQEACHQTMVTDQLQQRLEGEIKRLQTMISDKQTLEDGLITDLNRKLQEATSRCQRLEHTRNEAEKRLLYATLENERLNFLLSTQASTMKNLKSDFNVIENLAHQQIDLLDDRTHSPSNGTRTSTTCSNNNNKASNPIITIIDNHHRNYRQYSAGNPSTSASDDCCNRSTSSSSSSSNSNQQPFSSRHRRRDWQQQSPNADTTINTTTSAIKEKPDACSVVVEKLRKQKRHYGFKNIAEKESDGGNDANDLKPSHPPPTPQPPSSMGATTKVLDGGGCQESGTEAAFRHKQQDDHEMNVHCKASAVVACGNRNAGRTGTLCKSPPLQSSLMGSLSSIASIRLGPARRTIWIDSDCELSLPEQERPTDDDGDDGDHGNNGAGNQTYAVTDPAAKKRFPLTDGPSATTAADDDADVGGIGSSKTNNDCASLRRWQQHQRQETDMGQQQPRLGWQVLDADRGRSSPSKGKEDKDGDKNDVVLEKYPRDYGDKFERRESCLLQSKKELCQNRPIIGQIRQGNSSDDVEAGNHPKKDAKLKEGRKTISAANELAFAPTTEEFSIDFDDITLPSSPAPFRGGCLSSIAGGSASDDY